MREIREYNMNGTIILGVDNGYGNVKTAHRVFPTGIIKCDSEPVLSKEYIEYDGAYYIIGEGHKGFVADKQEDDDTYFMTLAAIAKELEARGLTEARIHLAVGLPLKWVQAQRESFKKYLTRERYVSLKYRRVRNGSKSVLGRRLVLLERHFVMRKQQGEVKRDIVKCGWCYYISW